MCPRRAGWMAAFGSSVHRHVKTEAWGRETDLCRAGWVCLWHSHMEVWPVWEGWVCRLHSDRERPSELEKFGKDECCLPVRAPGPSTTSLQPTTPSLCMLTCLMWALLFLQSECSACIFSLFDLSFSSSWCFPIGSWGCWKHHELWDPWDYTVPWLLSQKEVND